MSISGSMYNWWIPSYVSLTNNRKHIYDDLQPYVCIFDDCNFNNIEFIDRKTWIGHLRTEHRLGTSDKDYSCPLCLELVSPGTMVYTHISKHLEEISLAALPKGDEDSVCQSDASSISGSLHTRLSGGSVAEIQGSLHLATGVGQLDVDPIAAAHNTSIDSTVSPTGIGANTTSPNLDSPSNSTSVRIDNLINPSTNPVQSVMPEPVTGDADVKSTTSYGSLAANALDPDRNDSMAWRDRPLSSSDDEITTLDNKSERNVPVEELFQQLDTPSNVLWDSDSDIYHAGNSVNSDPISSVFDPEAVTVASDLPTNKEPLTSSFLEDEQRQAPLLPPVSDTGSSFRRTSEGLLPVETERNLGSIDNLSDQDSLSDELDELRELQKRIKNRHEKENAMYEISSYFYSQSFSLQFILNAYFGFLVITNPLIASSRSYRGHLLRR